jgi:hypothetical protein
MCSAMDGAALPAPGCPIRRSAGQRLFSASPRLIAAVHVLPRLLVPRHPPCALNILTVSSARAPKDAIGAIRRRARGHGRRKNTLLAFVQFSSFAEASRAEDFRPRSLKTEQRSRCRHRARGPGRHLVHVRSTLGLLPRKEVIQPQLPLRLPCYDFTPITSPTFDGCLP